MTSRLWFWMWTWHILAGAAGVLVSVGAFYQWLEQRFNSYKKLQHDAVQRIVDETGRELSDAECTKYIVFFNSLTDMGNVSLPVAQYSTGTKVYLQSREVYQVVLQGQFYEIRLTKRTGKRVYFRLYDKRQEVAGE